MINKNNQGFTFIELILAMVILSVIVTGGYSLINSSYKVVTKQTGLTDMRNDLRIALIQMTKDIQESESVIDNLNGNEPFVFVQTNNSVSYLFDETSKQLFRKSGTKQTVLIENISSFLLTAIESDTQFELEVLVNEEKHILIITRRIKGNLNEINFGSVSGQILDINSSWPVNNATLIVKSNETGFEHWFITNNTGVFFVTNLLAGEYELTVNATGYYSKAKSLSIGQDENKENETIFLTPIPIEPPEIISFVFEKSENPASIPIDYPNNEIIGVINNTAKTIEIDVPYGTDIDSLIPTLTVTEGATVSPNSGSINDFSTPQIYTVTGANGVSTEYVVTVRVSNNTFVDFILEENVFVYGTQLSFQGGSVIGPDATMVINGNIDTNSTNQGASLGVSNIYIDGYVNLLTGSASLGSMSNPGEIHINGDLKLWDGTRHVYGDVFVNGDLYLKDARIHGNVYVAGDVTLDWTPWLANDARIYYTGSLTWPTGNYSSSILGKCIHQDSVPTAEIPEHLIPDLKADSWYVDRGYRTDNPSLSNNIKIFSSNYTGSSNAQNVIIVSKGDINITGWRTVTGIFYAPHGKVTFHQGYFEGLVIARDGFFYTGGGGSVTFKGIEHYINDPNDYPF